MSLPQDQRAVSDTALCRYFKIAFSPSSCANSHEWSFLTKNGCCYSITKFLFYLVKHI